MARSGPVSSAMLLSGSSTSAGLLGQVYHGTLAKKNEPVSIKIINLVDVSFQLPDFARFIPASAKHLLKFHTSFVERNAAGAPSNLWIALEQCSGGPASKLAADLLDKNAFFGGGVSDTPQAMGESSIAYILKTVVLALDTLHTAGWPHGMLTGSAILLLKSGDVRLLHPTLIDLVARTEMQTLDMSFWLAPEVLNGRLKKPDVRSDTWSLGMIAIELATGAVPVIEPQLDIGTQLAKYEFWSPTFLDFLRVCLQPFESRPPAKALLQHDLLRGFDADYAKMDLLDAMTFSSITESGASPDQDDESESEEEAPHEDEPRTTRSMSVSAMSRPPAGWFRTADAASVNAPDNLVSLRSTSTRVLVRALRERYRRGVSYTFVGDVLLAVGAARSAVGHDKADRTKFGVHKPATGEAHAYALAQQAYKAMWNSRTNQSIIARGVAGSGKSAVLHHVLRLLLARQAQGDIETALGLDIENMIGLTISCATPGSPHATRATRYVEVLYDFQGKVIGTRWNVFSLESSHLHTRRPMETSFLLLNAFVAGMSQRMRDLVNAPSASKFRYLDTPNANLSSFVGPDAAKRYRDFTRTLQALGMPDRMIEGVEITLGVILNLGDVTFVAKAGSKREPLKLDNTASEVICKLLGFNKQKLTHLLTSVPVRVNNQVVLQPCTLEQALAMRDAIAANMYLRLVNWLLERTNELAQPHGRPSTSISLLDYAGFDSGAHTLDRLYANIANEYINYFYCNTLFTVEMKALVDEGLEPPALPVIDTVPTMALFFARPHGFVRMIDAETTAAKPSDAAFLQHFLHAHTASNSPSARAVTAGKGLQFTVTHFAGPVSYNAQAFLYQNREQVPETLAIVLQGCRLDVIRSMYAGTRTAVGLLESDDPAAKEEDDGVTTFNKDGKLKVDKKKKKQADTAAANMGRLHGKRFLTSWKALLANLEASTPHYVLCVSPTKASGEFFLDDHVSSQLQALRVAETLILRRDAHTLRFTFADFVSTYQSIAFELTAHPPATPATVRHILALASVCGAQFGLGAVFLNHEQAARMTYIMDRMHVRASRLTALVRGFLLRRKMHTIREEKERAIRLREAEEKRVGLLKQMQQEAMEAQARIAEMIAGKRMQRRASFDTDAETEFAEIDEDDKPQFRGAWSLQERRDAAIRACGLYSSEAYRQIPDNICSTLVPFTKDLNRYINILPTWASLVKLKTPVTVPLSAECEHLDDNELQVAERTRARYINANFIRGYDGSPQAYIATMGPTALTTPAFWQMIWDYNCKGIVMVTHLKERGQDKCHRYWPTKLYNPNQDVGQVAYGDIEVYVLAGRKRHDHIVSELAIRFQGETRTVTHYWFTGWPDHGVPSDPKGLMQLRDDVAQHTPGYGTSPLVVHCSAGIGRTGTYIAIDAGLRMLDSMARVDLLTMLRQLREDRGGMIQTEQQFSLVHSALRAYAEEKAIGLEPLPSADAAIGDSNDSNGDDSNEENSEPEESDASEDRHSLRRRKELLARQRALLNEDSDAEDEGTLKNLPYVVFDPADEPDGPMPRELTPRQRKLRTEKSRQREMQRRAVLKQLNTIEEELKPRAPPKGHRWSYLSMAPSRGATITSLLSLKSSSTEAELDIEGVIDRIRFLQTQLSAGEIAPQAFLDQRERLLEQGYHAIDLDFQDGVLTSAGVYQFHEQLRAVSFYEPERLARMSLLASSTAPVVSTDRADMVVSQRQSAAELSPASPPRPLSRTFPFPPINEDANTVPAPPPPPPPPPAPEVPPVVPRGPRLGETVVSSDPMVAARLRVTANNEPIWASVQYLERGQPLHSFDCAADIVTLSGRRGSDVLSIAPIDNSLRDVTVLSTRRNFGDFAIRRDENGDVWLQAHTKMPVTVEGAELAPDTLTRVFDVSQFKADLAQVFSTPIDLLAMSKLLDLTLRRVTVGKMEEGKPAPCELILRYEGAAIAVLDAAAQRLSVLEGHQSRLVRELARPPEWVLQLPPASGRFLRRASLAKLLPPAFRGDSVHFDPVKQAAST